MPVFRDYSQTNRTAENGLLRSRGLNVLAFLWMAHARSGFDEGIKRMHCDHKAAWHIVKESASRIGVAKLAPHDLRRTCARLCHASGGELEQIQFLLGHVSVQTTERYLGCKQRIRSAVNDRIGIEPTP
jgi:integrase